MRWREIARWMAHGGLCRKGEKEKMEAERKRFEKKNRGERERGRQFIGFFILYFCTSNTRERFS